MEVLQLKGKKKPSAKQLAARKRFAKIMKSGGFKKKSAKKSTKSVRKSVTVKRKRTYTKTMAKKKSSRSSRARSKVTGFMHNPTLKKVMLGVGASAVAGTVVNMVAPQFGGIAKPLAALAVGGPLGAVASIFLDGGLQNVLNFGAPAQSGGQTV